MTPLPFACAKDAAALEFYRKYGFLELSNAAALFANGNRGATVSIKGIREASQEVMMKTINVRNDRESYDFVRQTAKREELGRGIDRQETERLKRDGIRYRFGLLTRQPEPISP